MIKTLKTKKGRDEHGLFIVEGEKLVAEIPQDWRIRAYVVDSRQPVSITNRLGKRAPVLTVSDSHFSSLSDTITPQGIMAVCEKRNFTLKHLPKENPFILMGECLSDPGNIGTLIRTATAADVSGCILSAGSGDIYNPKVIRASAGAVLRVPIIEKADLPEIIAYLKQQGVLIIAAHLKGSVLPYDMDLRRGCAILVGNETHGLSDETSNLSDVFVKLPMAPGIESLNASVAGGILLYEVVRQRLG